MGILRNEKNGCAVELVAPARVGRSSDNHVVVPASCVSRAHAVIHRAKGLWHVRPLSARSPTQLNRILLRVNQSYPLRRGDRVCFGPAGAEEGRSWVLEDDSPPAPRLVSTRGVVLLNRERTPMASSAGQIMGAVERRSGAGGQPVFVLLRPGAETELYPGARFSLGGSEYRFVVGEELSSTVVRGGEQGPVLLRLYVSPCQERIRLELESLGVSEEVPMSSNRAELIRCLAEQRLRDSKSHIAPAEQGYTSELTKLLRRDAAWVTRYCYLINRAMRRHRVLGDRDLITWDAQTGCRRLQVDGVEILSLDA